MNSESKDAPKPSLIKTSEIRLNALEPKGKGYGAGYSPLDQLHPQ
jgi:hypothetical protein